MGLSGYTIPAGEIEASHLVITAAGPARLQKKQGLGDRVVAAGRV